MKAGIVGIALEDALKVAKSIPGINVLGQKGFIKITGNMPNKAVYPTNTKIVSEIHFSGFAIETKTKVPGLIANPKWPKPTKRVTHFLDQREGVVTREQILANFEAQLKSMVTSEVTQPVNFEAPIAPKPVAAPVEEKKEAEVVSLIDKAKELAAEIVDHPEQAEKLEEIIAIAAEQHGEEGEEELTEEDEWNEFLEGTDEKDDEKK